MDWSPLCSLYVQLPVVQNVKHGASNSGYKPQPGHRTMKEPSLTRQGAVVTVTVTLDCHLMSRGLVTMQLVLLSATFVEESGGTSCDRPHLHQHPPTQQKFHTAAYCCHLNIPVHTKAFPCPREEDKQTYTIGKGS